MPGIAPFNGGQADHPETAAPPVPLSSLPERIGAWK